MALPYHNLSLSPEAAAGEKAEPPPARLDPPRTVIRGESGWIIKDPDTGERRLVVPVGKRGEGKVTLLPASGVRPFGAITDWVNCSFIGERAKDPLGLLTVLLGVLGTRFYPAEQTGRGFLGWDQSFTLGETGGRFAYGGQKGTAFLSLSGGACAAVKGWEPLVDFLADCGARITRWDGAVDDYLGDHTVEDALAMYERRLFCLHGRPPRLKQYGNWVSPDGTGRTVQIGLRQHGKMIRIYEKGMELGAPFHPWVRWEVELHNRDREIPLDVLLQPGRFAVGAYPRALAWVQGDMSRIETIRRTQQISYDVMVGNAKAQYGRAVHVMLTQERSAERVVELLRTEGIPKRLKHPLVDNPSEWLE